MWFMGAVIGNEENSTKFGFKKMKYGFEVCCCLLYEYADANCFSTVARRYGQNTKCHFWVF